MAFCTKCGAQNADGSAHCTTCGSPLAAGVAAPPPAAPPMAPLMAPPMAPPIAPPAAPQYAPPGAPAMYAPMPAAPAQPNFFAVMWKSLDLGAKIAGVGAIVAAIAFFLPLMGSGDYMANGIRLASGESGSGGDPAYWGRLLLSIVALGLLYFYYNNDLRTKIIVATAHCAIGSIWGFQILRVASGSDFARYMQFGWYALTLGLLAIAVGGFMSILDLTKRLTGVR